MKLFTVYVKNNFTNWFYDFDGYNLLKYLTCLNLSLNCGFFLWLKSTSHTFFPFTCMISNWWGYYLGLRKKMIRDRAGHYNVGVLDGGLENHC